MSLKSSARTVLAAVALVALAAVTATPAGAQERPRITPATSTAGSWHITGNWYLYKRDCVDAGQQYEREGFPYQCRYGYLTPAGKDVYWLYIYN
ncbi:hypothetical protein AB0D08_37575 [Kitasatospora sp. NPDC048540]|uniref:hypothetical protein n=1 Tax=Kitasatospora sp. NPDC048540 TaxID=3155634 RepID=UPI0033E177C7